VAWGRGKTGVGEGLDGLGVSRELPVLGNADGTVAGLLVSYEGFQRLAHVERARANGDTRTVAEAARQLEYQVSPAIG